VQNAEKAPVHRSRLRLAFGRQWYTLRRYLYWLFGGARFARLSCDSDLPNEYFSHATPLLRKLRDVDMQLQNNKVVNLRLAAERVNSIIISPGEVFSYWRLIGKTTARKGYLPGMVLRGGRVTSGIGGGLCQLSNLIYWMTLHTPLTVVERHRHSYDVFPDAGRTQPFGSGATCFYNYGDLMIRNDTDAVFQLKIEVGEEYLRGAWMCEKPPWLRYEVFEKDHCFNRTVWGPCIRNNAIWRRVYEGDIKIREEFVTENHALMMYEPMIGAGEHEIKD